MAGKICAVFGCNNYNVTNCSKSFFRFPRDENQCKQWVVKCKRADLDVILKKKGAGSLYTRTVCSEHFRKEDYRNPNLPSQGLIKIPIDIKYVRTIRAPAYQVNLWQQLINSKSSYNISALVSLPVKSWIYYLKITKNA